LSTIYYDKDASLDPIEAQKVAPGSTKSGLRSKSTSSKEWELLCGT
jgi:hypothetical protein